VALGRIRAAISGLGGERLCGWGAADDAGGLPPMRWLLVLERGERVEPGGPPGGEDCG
jgi:hypothetical protein